MKPNPGSRILFLHLLENLMIQAVLRRSLFQDDTRSMSQSIGSVDATMAAVTFTAAPLDSDSIFSCTAVSCLSCSEEFGQLFSSSFSHSGPFHQS